VRAMSASECAAETKPASYADGARYTPRSSMAWKKRLKRLLVALHDLGVGRRRHGAKIKAEPAPDGLRGTRKCRDRAQTRQGPRRAVRAGRGKSFIETRRLELFQGRKSRSDRNRIARQRTGLVYGPQRGDFPHGVAAAAECATGIPPPIILPSVDEVRPHSVELLGALQSDAKARHHFVEDQHRAVLRACSRRRSRNPGRGAISSCSRRPVRR